MRNLQDDDLKLSYSNVFALNKNSQLDVIEKGESIALGFEISNSDLEEWFSWRKKLFFISCSNS